MSALVCAVVELRLITFASYFETGDGHGSAVDWWTFGIFLYELLFGKTPFKGSGNRATLFNVVGQPLKFPESATGQVSFAARDLIRGLLVKEPVHRLASKRGAGEIKAHPFFEGNFHAQSLLVLLMLLSSAYMERLYPYLSLCIFNESILCSQ